MKTKAWLITLVASLGAGALLAQDSSLSSPASPAVTPAAPAISDPAPLAPLGSPSLAPAASEAADAKADAPKPKKKAVKKPALISSGLPAARTTLNPPAPATVKVESLNIRGLPSLSGEVIAKLKKGETVTILEEVTLDKVRKDEPAKWVKIQLSTNVPVWVAAHLIDPATKAVTVNKLNLRGGAGEDFNVLGTLEKGAVVKEIKTKGSWIHIETPANAGGYVSADFLDKKPAPETNAAPAPAANETPAANVAAAPVSAPDKPAVAAVAPNPTPAKPVVQTPPQQAVVTVPPDTGSTVLPPIDAAPAPAPAPAPTQPVAAAPAVSEPAATPAVVESPTPAAATPAEPAPAATAPATAFPTLGKDEIIAKRIVTREGIVRKARNIQAPTDFELRDLRTGELLDFLFAPKDKIVLKDYVGQKVTVRGEEYVDRRWKYTPVIELDTIDPL
jgi:uncharacterized protein YgiM (DUF1202 family)